MTFLIMHGASPDLKDAKGRECVELGSYGLDGVIEDALEEYESKVKEDKRRKLFDAIEKAGESSVSYVLCCACPVLLWGSGHRGCSCRGLMAIVQRDSADGEGKL